MPSHVYLLASRPYGTLYLGVTRNLGRRIVEHRQKTYPGFSAKYGVDRLVWMEDYDRIVDAIAREKMIKKWRRAWKIADRGDEAFVGRPVRSAQSLATVIPGRAEREPGTGVRRCGRLRGDGDGDRGKHTGSGFA